MRRVNDINLHVAADNLSSGQRLNRATDPLRVRATVGINEQQYFRTGCTNACIAGKPRPRLTLAKKAHVRKLARYRVKRLARAIINDDDLNRAVLKILALKRRETADQRIRLIEMRDDNACNGRFPRHGFARTAPA